MDYIIKRSRMPRFSAQNFVVPRPLLLQASSGIKLLYLKSPKALLLRLRLLLNRTAPLVDKTAYLRAELALALLCNVQTSLKVERGQTIPPFRLSTGQILNFGHPGVETCGPAPLLRIMLGDLTERFLALNFADNQVEELKATLSARIEAEKSHPTNLARLLMLLILLGPEHPYGQFICEVLNKPKTAESISVREIKEFYHQFFTPKLLTLLAVIPSDGDVETTLMQSLETFSIRDENPLLVHPQAEPKPRFKTHLLLKSVANVKQSIICVGTLAPPSKAPESAAWRVAAALIAEMLSSRLNLHLREREGWTYGMRTMTLTTGVARPTIFYLSVDINRTRDAIEAIQTEFSRLLRHGGVADDEFERAKFWVASKISSMNNTGAEMIEALQGIASEDLSTDHYQRLLADLECLTIKDLHRVLEQVFNPQSLNWLVLSTPETIARETAQIGYPTLHLDYDSVLTPS